LQEIRQTEQAILDLMRREREHLGREKSNLEVAFKIVKNEFFLITDSSS
jgi:hypothetical protein